VGSRAAVKAALVVALGSQSEAARNAAAQAIAKAGGIDVPASEWPELIPGLLGAAMNPGLDPGMKAATLKALGYLLEELPGEAVDQDTVNRTLTAIVDSMQAGRPRDLVRAAVTALYAALDFAGENFSDGHEAERNMLMTAMCQSTQAEDGPTRAGGFECIVHVAELYYGALGSYMNTLAQLTFAAARGADEACAVRALDFWTTIAEEEERLGGDDEDNRKYILTALQPLVAMLTGLMCTQSEEDGEDTYSTAQAAGSCLAAVAKVAGDAVLEHVMPFVNGSFGSGDWHAREAATLALGVVLEGPAPATLAPLINKALPPMLDRLAPAGAGRDPSAPVRDTTAWTIGKAFEVLFDSLDQAALFARTVEVLNAALDDEPRVAQNAAYALHNIASHTGAHENDGGATPLSPYLMTLIGHLMGRCDRDDWDECNLRTACYETINMIVENAGTGDAPILGRLLEEAAKRLQASLAKPITSSDEREEQGGLQVLLTALIQTIAVQLDSAIVSAADVLVTLLLRVFEHKLPAAAEEAYRALGAIAAGCGGEFARFMPAVFPRVQEGLANIAEYQVCNAAVWCAGELCRSLDAAVVPYMQQIAGALLAALQSMELNRSVKPAAIGALGDLALAVGPALEPQLGMITMLLDQAAATALPEVSAGGGGWGGGREGGRERGRLRARLPPPRLPPASRRLRAPALHRTLTRT
jgi:importin subunit beta-1